MENVVFSLGIDEVAMSLILVGQEEAAKRHVANVLGKIDASEVKGRLLAAFDSLLARGLVGWSEEKQKAVLDGTLEALVETIASPDVSVVATVFKGEGIEIMAFHFGGRASAGVRDRGLLGQELRPLDGPEAASASIEELMDWPESLDEKRYTVSLTPEQLENVSKLSNQDQGVLEGYLAGIGLEAESLKAFSSDLINTESRGTVVRLDYEGDVARVDRGFLTLKSAERCWILTPTDGGDNPLVDGGVATREELRSELAELMG
jgi:hypothetical protein